MIALMIIGFLCSRWLLQALGVEDYGIYSVVGSVASTFVALKSLFSESIQRFINYYKGENNIKIQSEVFSIAIIIHVVLAIIFVVLLEVVGLWLINNKLVFPIEKYDTVVFVFHMTVIASVFSILCIPYDAVIIANECMGFFAFVSIFDGLLRLGVIFFLPFLPFEPLRVYSVLLVVIPALTLLLYYLYCLKRRFPECVVSFKFDKSLLKEILSLSSWNFFGNISFSILHEGINFILNIFGGLTYNAARAIAYQVKSIAVQFSTNSLIAVRPMVMQSAARKDDNNKQLFKNIIEVSRISFFIMLIPVIPIVALCSQLLNIWLTILPDNAVLFTQLVAVGVLFRALHEPLNMLYMSVGKLKRMMLLEVFIMLFSILAIYYSLSEGLPLWLSFVMLAVMEIIIVVCLVVNAYREFNFPLATYNKYVFIPFTILSVFNLGMASIMSFIQIEGILYTIILGLFSVIWCMGTICLFLSKEERILINELIKKYKSI